MSSLPALLVVMLSEQQQAAVTALTCEKMEASIAAFDAQEKDKGGPLFKEAITALLAFSLGHVLPTSAYERLTARLEAYWPDLDESANPMASYAFDACVALSEALAFVQERDSSHVLQCLTAATDTVDMYVQDIEELDLEPTALNAFIEASAVMQQERHRQAWLIHTLLEHPQLDTATLTAIRQDNAAKPLIDLTIL